MRMNHIIIGTDDVNATSNFYITLFGFEDAGSFVDTGTGDTGRILHYRSNNSDLDFMIVPFIKARLPNPQHIAIEVSNLSEFKSLYTKAESMGLSIRAEASLKSQSFGVGQLDLHGKSYDIFYILDPGSVNVEVMCLK